MDIDWVFSRLQLKTGLTTVCAASWISGTGSTKALPSVNYRGCYNLFRLLTLLRTPPASISHIDSSCYTQAGTELHKMTQSSCPHSSLFRFESKWLCHWEPMTPVLSMFLIERKISLARAQESTKVWLGLPSCQRYGYEILPKLRYIAKVIGMNSAPSC